MHDELPEGVDQREWQLACNCANLFLIAQVLTEYDHPRANECAEFFRTMRNTIGDDAIYEMALAAARSNFDEETLRTRCEKLRRRREQEETWAVLQKARLPASHGRAWKRASVGQVISHHRYQLAVGQGGFHLGTLQEIDRDETNWRGAMAGDALAEADFVYAYDCGSDPLAGVKAAVSSVVKRRPSRKLDMLFVSHFDRDHICGIPHLLDARNGLRVDTVVMPYLDDVDRIVAFGRCADMAASPATLKFHADIVVDPIAAMRRFDPRQIILISPSSEEEDLGFFDLPPTDPPTPAPDTIAWKARDADGVWAAVAQARMTRDGATILARSEFIVGSAACGGWRLKPYVKRAKPGDREAFATAMEVLLRWPRGSFRQRVQDKLQRRDMVTKHRTLVSRAYAWTFGDKNETSLSLYSGPLDPRDAGAVFRGMPLFSNARVGWLGTGDAGLCDPTSINNFQNFYKDELDWVSTFVLPHHGSIHNTDPSNLVSDADLWVAAAQPTRRTWKHPAPEIVTAIKARGAKFHKVGSNPKSLLEERIIVFWPQAPT